jgi:hypothetical protein
VCNGNSGTFTASATAKLRKSQRPVAAVEREVPDVVAREDGRGNDADEHEGGPEHRVEEELRGRVHAPVVAPSTDQEVHRDEHDLEEQEEEEEIEAEETAHHAGLEHEQPREIALLVVVRVHSDDDEREEDPGEHHEEERDAVHPEMPRDSPCVDPAVAGHELEPGLVGVESREHPQRDAAGHHRRRECRELHELRPAFAEERDQQGTRDRDENERGQDRERQYRVFCAGRSS